MLRSVSVTFLVLSVKLKRSYVSTLYLRDGQSSADVKEAIESENCVGMIGATLGGGVGRYNALHGVLLDSLLSVKMVTAAGHVITASTAENSDLFWGIRGAGFNFGTILEATYSIYDETAPLVLNADFLFAANASQTILEYFKSLEDGLPAKLSLVLLAAYSAELGVSFPVIPTLQNVHHLIEAMLYTVLYYRQRSLRRPSVRSSAVSTGPLCCLAHQIQPHHDPLVIHQRCVPLW